MKITARCGHEMKVPPAAINKVLSGFMPHMCKDCYQAVNPPRHLSKN